MNIIERFIMDFLEWFADTFNNDEYPQEKGDNQDVTS